MHRDKQTIKVSNLSDLFFELIQVAIGTRICLSHTPSVDEWGDLYTMAKKQSLVGVCFAGVQRLATSTGSATEQRQEPPEMLYLTWMGMAAKIQQRNEVVNRQCVDLQKRLSADGLQSLIMKGQGVASLYDEHLRGLRQSGDIDVLVDAKLPELLQYVNGVAPTKEVDRHHIHFDVFQDTEVELHYVPINHPNPWKNKVLQSWFAETKKNGVVTKFRDGEIVTPCFEFNAVFLLMHIYHHFFNEGVGMRQLMDYYFVLSTVSSFDSALESGFRFQEVSKVVSSLGLNRFASALTWVIAYVFEGNNKLKPETLKPSETPLWMLWQPNEEDGRILLDEILRSGNFGKMGDNDILKMNVVKRIWHRLGKQVRLSRFDRTHFLWSPLFSLDKKLWQRKHGYKGCSIN